MNKKNFIIAMLIPALAILGFAVYNYYTYSAGEEILLKTVPVDPRDLLRGDYVNLGYEISTINLSNTPHTGNFNSKDEIYATLSMSGKFWSVTQAGAEKPALQRNEVCMKGKVTNTYGGILRVRWGIESYFVPEGKGRDIELNTRNVSVKAAVDSNCRAVIKELYINDNPVKFGS
ncbi:MAG: GDYXXLXY domain-containing protein [Candidatus Methanoperedens sp.]|jgi:uncharacterized membrane-anchored protein|nr:GDYXXLXY domain-containing protein [Candidatus Methanoperedens sp.]PKL53886.1 MAG: hypothetical protein CVV36_04685 [Candidatus Methanoperedenaceae archaeon HGW-Methanoperedenaceae-1]